MRLSGKQRRSTARSLSHIGMAVFMAFFMTLLIGCSSGGAGQTAAESTSGESAASAVTSSGESAASAETSSDEQTASQPESAADASLDESANPGESTNNQTTESDASANDTALADSCPKSVVAVSKSIAELWLLSGGTLAGTTEDAMDLDGITEDTQVIGTLSRPSSEAVLALSPDLVLLTEDIPAQKELKTELMGMGINTMTIEIGCFADYLACMDELTNLTGRKDLFEQNAVAVGERIAVIKAQAASRADAAAETFLAMRVSATKNKVFKDSYFACEIFRDFGLRNIAEGNSNLDELSLEAIVAADPDYIFVIPQGKEEEAMESYRAQFESSPVWSELSAVKANRIFIMPKDYFQYKPNAKWDLAYEYVRDLLQES